VFDRQPEGKWKWLRSDARRLEHAKSPPLRSEPTSHRRTSRRRAFKQAQKIASALTDNYAGKEASPPDLARALGVSLTSSSWPAFTGSAIAYGLAEGGVNASKITLLALGRKPVAPEAEGQDLDARREAILRPRI
jgi:hypothetical protein